MSFNINHNISTAQLFQTYKAHKIAIISIQPQTFYYTVKNTSPHKIYSFVAVQLFRIFIAKQKVERRCFSCLSSTGACFCGMKTRHAQRTNHWSTSVERPKTSLLGLRSSSGDRSALTLSQPIGVRM